MNWSRAKTILIIFLLCANLFYLFELATSSYNATHISKEVISASVTLLNQRGISINEGIIPDKAEKQRIFSVANVITDYEVFAKSVFDKELETVEGGYSCDEGNVLFSGDCFEINFTNGLKTPAEQKSPADKVRGYLAGLGINAEKAKVSVSNNSNGVFKVILTKEIDSKQLFDCKIEAVLNGSEITSIRGSWFAKCEENTAQTAELETVPGLLIRFCAAHPEASGSEITDLKYGYVVNDVDDGLYHKQSTLIPVLAVTLNTGSTFYIDARAN